MSKRLWLPVILVVAVLVFIWGNSALPGLDSYKLVVSVFGEMSNETMMVVRKLAHVVEFGVLAAVIGVITRNPSVVIRVGVAVAMIDEGIQSFIPGRTCELSDFALDVTVVVVVACLVRSITYDG